MKKQKIYHFFSRICSGIFVLILTVQLAAQQKSEIEWKIVDNVSIPVPPAEHPRVFLRAGDINDLKRRIAHPVLKPVWDELQELANSNVQIRIEVDAARFLMTGDTKLGKQTISLALKTLENATYDLTGQDITRPIGRMMVTGSVAYDWCYPLLTPGQKKAFQTQFLRLAKQLECGYPPKAMGWVTGHGSEWMVMRDMLATGLAIYNENPEMYRYAAVIFFTGLLPVRNWWYPGHAFHQGTSYSETRFSSDLYPLWIFDRLGAGNVYHPAQQFVPYQWIYIRRPDGQLLRAGDGQNREPKLRSLLCASYYSDGYVLSDYLKNPGIDPMSKLFQLLWSDPDLKPLPISDLPLTRYMGFPYGWMVARTGWGENSVIAEMKVNVYNFGNHQHHDAGAFQIFYRGPLALDAGLYEGVGGECWDGHNLNYNKRTIAHNSLLIYDPDEKFETKGFYGKYKQVGNDGGQRLPNQWREPRNLDMLLTGGYKTGTIEGHWFGPDAKAPAFTYLKGDITEAYSAKVRQVKRSFVFLNLDGAPVPAALVVFDRVVSSNPEFKKYWLLHSMERPAIDGNTTVISLSQRGWSGKLVNTTMLPTSDNSEITAVGGPGKEFWVFGTNWPNEIPPDRDPNRYEIGEWRVEVSPKKAAETDLFLNVMQVMNRNAHPIEATHLDSPELVGVRIADCVVFFNREASFVDQPVSFSLLGAGTYKILVTDLSEGTWQVKKDNKVIIPAIPVRSDDGVLYFEGTKGEYKLLR